VFSLGVGAMLLGLAAVGLFNKQLAPTVILAIFLFFAGGLSNLIDRLTLGGYVVDFMNIGIGPVRTGIFNVADMFVMAGGGLFILQGLLHRRHSVSHSQSS
jgi:signal peptidase II